MPEHNVKNKKQCALLIIKYSFSVVITFLAYSTNRSVTYLLFSMIELLLVISLSQFVLEINAKIGHVVHFFLMAIYNIQTAVMYFSGSYVTLIMLTNIASFQALQGNFVSYALMAVLFLAFTIIPVSRVNTSKKERSSLYIYIYDGICGSDDGNDSFL